MLVQVLQKNVPNVGKRGDVKDIDVPSAKLLIHLGMVSKYEKKVVMVEETSEVEAAPIRKKRTYRRRDMKAEETVAVVAEEVKEEPKEEVPEEQTEENTE